MTRRWRTARFKKPGGVYWTVIAGRNETRLSLSLKYVTEEQADRARARIQAEEDAGTIERLLSFHARDPEGAIEFLTGDGPDDLAKSMPAVGPDYGRMVLSEYQRDVYAPRRAVVRPRTWRTEREHWVRILADLGEVKLRDVEPRMFARWVRGLRVRHTKARRDKAGEDGTVPASGSYQRLLRSALQALLSFAYLEGHVERHVRLGDVRLSGSTLSARVPVDPLSVDEVRALLAAARTPTRRAMWAVGVGQGLRPGELVRVQWEDVDWDGRMLTVRGTKTEEAAAVVPMTPPAYAELRTLWESKGKPEAGLVFVRARTKLETEDGRGSSYRVALRADATAAGIARPVFPYLLRHSFATLAWALGMDKDVARRIMRHTDLAMLDRVYTRPRPADLAKRVAGFQWAAPVDEEE